MTDPSVTRRDFVKSASAATIAAPWILTSPALGRPGRRAAGERITIGFIGCGKRAFELIGPFLDHDATQVIAVCDVDTTRRAAMKKRVDEKYASSGTSGCPAYNDYKEVIARADIDAVVITTPDHWHITQCIEAAKAKKDIYCEKPLTLNLHECKAVIDAVRKHDRVFQTGSQQRTEYDGKFRTACEYVRSGRIGEVISVNVGVGESSVPCNLPAETPEPGLDWDRWLGPAPVRPYNSILSPRGVHSHYPNWRLYLEYSGGMMTDFGAHHYDIAQWGLAMDSSGPIEVHPPTDPNSMYGARFLYPNGVQMFHGGPGGTTFVGRAGIIAVDRGRLNSVPGDILKKELTDKDVHLPKSANHIDNWIDCVKSRQRCICDVEVGARSVAVCHLANLAYWHRRPLKWDPQKWEFPGDAEANSWRDCKRREGYELPRA